MIRHISLCGVTLHDLDNPSVGTIVARAIGLRGLGAPDRASYPAWGHGSIDLTSRTAGEVISLEGECIDAPGRTAVEGVELIQDAVYRCLGRDGTITWTEQGTAGVLVLRRKVRLGTDSSVTVEGAGNRIQWQFGLVCTEPFALEQPATIVRGPSSYDRPFNVVTNPQFNVDLTDWSAVGTAAIDHVPVPAPMGPFIVLNLYPGCAPPLSDAPNACRVTLTAAGDGLTYTATGGMTTAALFGTPDARVALYVWVSSLGPASDLTLTANVPGGATETVTLPIVTGMHDMWVRIGVPIAVSDADCEITLTGTPVGAAAQVYVACVSLTSLANDLYIDGDATTFGGAWSGTPHDSATLASVVHKYVVQQLPSGGYGEQPLQVGFVTAGTGHAVTLIYCDGNLTIASGAGDPATGVATNWDSRSRVWSGGVPPLAVLVTGTKPPAPRGGVDHDGILSAPRLLCFGAGGGSVDAGDTTVGIIAQRAHI